MLENMIFGRFIPGNSYIHRLDPRAKLIAVFAFIILVFLANNVVTYAILVAFTLVVILASKIRLYFIVNGLKPILFLMVFTFGEYGFNDHSANSCGSLMLSFVSIEK